MTLPNFLIIGAAKSGTTALFRYLKQHPQIYMSPKKEPHYFSFDDKSKMTKGPGDLIPSAVTDFRDYLALFNEAPNGSMVGEASTSYLYRLEAPERIHKALPGVKLIAVLRNPADRAFSAYMHLIRDKREEELNFRIALGLENDRISENWDPIWHYTNVGMYGHQLSRYFSYFKPEQIKIFLYEDFVDNQLFVIKSIFEFLEIDNQFTPDISVKMNVSGAQKSHYVQKFVKKVFDSPNLLRWAARKIFPETLRWRFTESIRQKNLDRQILSYEDRCFLIDIFRDDIQKLEELINRDLSNWFTC